MRKKSIVWLLSALVLSQSVIAYAESPFTSVNGTAEEAQEEVQDAAQEEAQDAAQATVPAATLSAGQREIPEIDGSAPLKYQLTPVGTLTDENRGFYFTHDSVLVPDGTEYAFLASNGEKLVSGVSNLDYIDNGIYEVQQELEEDNVNKTGLFTSDGEVLLGCEAASVATPHNRKDGIRFVAVIYATERTENENECIIYFTSDWFSLSVGDDDVMYKGYVRVFDLLNKQFVDGVQFDNYTRYGLNDLGDSFLLEHDGVYTMFDASGNQLWETTGYVNGVTRHALAASVNGRYYIVDNTGADRFSNDRSISDVNAANDYFTVYQSNDGAAGYQVVDIDGNPVCQTTLPIVFTADANYFRSEDDARNAYYVVDRSGQIVIDNVDSMSNVLGSYSFVKVVGQEDVTLLTPNGMVEGLTDEYAYSLFFSKDESCIALNTGEAFLTPSDDVSVTTIKEGLLRVTETSSQGDVRSLYDLFTGTQLLSGYTDIQLAGNMIYATTDRVNYDVFKLELVTA